MSDNNSHSARFVSGSLMRHIVVMAITSGIGLTALFFVDLLDMFFISMLGKAELAAAIGFAGTMVFFNMSVSIGFSIAMSVLVARALGAREEELARKQCGTVLLFAFIGGAIVTTLVLINLNTLLATLGADGEIARKAESYLRILMPSAPVLAMAMSACAALRAKGDPKNSMVAIICGGVINALFDPLFIFVFDMGMEGAAWASVLARCGIFICAFYVLCTRHRLISMPDWAAFRASYIPVTIIAIPAIISNFAMPLSNAFVIRELAFFGDDFVSGFAVVGRVQPIAFALLFALPGAVGPIISQNFGANRLDRVKTAAYNAMLFVIIYCLLISVILWLLRAYIGDVFNLSGEAYDIVKFFFTWIAAFSALSGLAFVTNAILNNLEKPLWATYLNLARATLGTLPFVILGGKIAGAEGVLLGQGVGALLFGLLACMIGIYRITILREKSVSPKKGSTESGSNDEDKDEGVIIEPVLPMTPFCSSRAYLFEETEVCRREKQRDGD